MVQAEYYLGWYESDDGKSRKECKTILLYGEPLPGSKNVYYDWKHVNLPCPNCRFAHNFKRSEWSNGLKLSSMGDYGDSPLS